MKKITAKFIVNNLPVMAKGKHIFFRGAEYWMHCNLTDDCKSDLDNGTLYYICEERKINGCINGYEYGKVINGIAYRI